MTIRFYANATKSAAKSAAKSLAAKAVKAGLSVSVRGSCDAIVALGGDGTILRAVKRFPDVPVLGFNLGSLGYLASVGEVDFESALSMLAAGRFSVSERTMLEVDGFTALNDVVIMREMTGHAAILDLAAGASSATRYLADGVIIATPTGSTAYSLASGGPVLMPDTRSFVVTPMNPHALGVRPMVVSDSVRLRVTSRRHISGSSERLGVYADGENVRMLSVGETIEVVKSDRSAKLMELDGYDPYEVLNRKLGWAK
jgi:NAD+ kinase